MATSLPRRLLRALRWAFLGRQAADGVGRLARPRVLFVEAHVTGVEAVSTLEGGSAIWTKIQLLETDGAPYRVAADVLRQAIAPSRGPGPDVPYRVVGELVRGGDLSLQTALGEALLLRAGTFDAARPEARPALRLEELPSELGGVWPGQVDAPRFAREIALRPGDTVRFEALFVPERHPRSGTGYRGDVDVRYRVDPAEGPILLEVDRPLTS